MRSLVSTLVAAALFAAARPASAQLCHVFPPVELHRDHDGHGAAHGSEHDHHGEHHHHGEHGHGHDAHHRDAPAAAAPHHVIASVSVEGAAIEGGDYQGVAPAVMWHHDWIGAMVSAPVYRLDDGGGDVAVGLGDVSVQVHARLIGGERAGAGVAAALGLPTGSAEDRLGMGHVMAMPGAWGMVTLDRVVLLGAASFGTSIGADAHAHHMHGGYPLVNPMNRLELGGSVRATYLATRTLSVQGLGTIAAPLDDTGVTRAAAGAGARWSAGAWSVTAEAQVGLVGDPFRVRGAVNVGRLF